LVIVNERCVEIDHSVAFFRLAIETSERRPTRRSSCCSAIFSRRRRRSRRADLARKSLETIACLALEACARSEALRVRAYGGVDRSTLTNRRRRSEITHCRIEITDLCTLTACQETVCDKASGRTIARAGPSQPGTIGKETRHGS
jgi:hypothetical protein